MRRRTADSRAPQRVAEDDARSDRRGAAAGAGVEAEVTVQGLGRLTEINARTPQSPPVRTRSRRPPRPTAASPVDREAAPCVSERAPRSASARAARASLCLRAARSARINACAAARLEGSESNVSVTSEENHDCVDLYAKTVNLPRSDARFSAAFASRCPRGR